MACRPTGVHAYRGLATYLQYFVEINAVESGVMAFWLRIRCCVFNFFVELFDCHDTILGWSGGDRCIVFVLVRRLYVLDVHSLIFRQSRLYDRGDPKSKNRHPDVSRNVFSPVNIYIMHIVLLWILLCWYSPIEATTSFVLTATLIKMKSYQFCTRVTIGEPWL